MLINSIDLKNFRNHSTYHLDFNTDTTLILGTNGWGKTSILEAVYILTRGKSFRATDPDIIKRGADFYRIALDYKSGESVVATYDKSIKTFKTTDKTSRRLPARAKYPVILFQPSDLNLISGPPSRRRDYFDRIFSDLSPEYSASLSKYNKALRQRNELLKAENTDRAALFPWDVILATYGSTIINLRRTLVDEIDASLTPTYRSIAENTDNVNLSYVTPFPTITKDAYLRQLEQCYVKDQALDYTNFGAHRDTVDFVFNHTIANGSASRGETRSIILSLKFVESNLTKQKLGESPIILLDDVFSELDETRRHALVNNFKTHQVVITSVEDINYYNYIAQ